MGWFRQTGVHALLFALLLRALLPAGWMLAPGNDGQLGFKICSAYDGLRVAPKIAFKGKIMADRDNQQLCPFAGGLHAAPLLAVAQLEPPARPGRDISFESEDAVQRLRILHTAQSPRGPPRLA